MAEILEEAFVRYAEQLRKAPIDLDVKLISGEPKK